MKFSDLLETFSAVRGRFCNSISSSGGKARRRRRCPDGRQARSRVHSKIIVPTAKIAPKMANTIRATSSCVYPMALFDATKVLKLVRDARFRMIELAVKNIRRGGKGSFCRDICGVQIINSVSSSVRCSVATVLSTLAINNDNVLLTVLCPQHPYYVRILPCTPWHYHTMVVLLFVKDFVGLLLSISVSDQLGRINVS